MSELLSSLAVDVDFQQPAEQSGIAEFTSNATDYFLAHPHLTTGMLVVAGVGAGALLEYRQRSKQAKRARALTQTYESELVAPHEEGRRGRAGRSLLSLAAAGGGLIGAAHAAAWIDFPAETGEEKVLPHVEVVVDKSGATLLDDQQDSTTIQRVISQLNTRDDIETTVQNAVDGRVEPSNLPESFSIYPFGGAPMSEAFRTSLDIINNKRDELGPGDRVDSSAIVILTDDNEIQINPLSTEVQRSQAPIVVFNVAEDPENSNSLETLVAETDGEYYGFESIDTDEELKEVVEDMLPSLEDQLQEDESGQGEKDGSKWWVSGASMLAAAAWYATRRRQSPMNTMSPTRQSRKERKAALKADKQES